jgi:hypothetical protein
MELNAFTEHESSLRGESLLRMEVLLLLLLGRWFADLVEDVGDESLMRGGSGREEMKRWSHLVQDIAEER